MFTVKYNGSYINAYTGKPVCYVTTDCGWFKGKVFKSVLAAKRAINKANRLGLSPSR